MSIVRRTAACIRGELDECGSSTAKELASALVKSKSCRGGKCDAQSRRRTITRKKRWVLSSRNPMGAMGCLSRRGHRIADGRNRNPTAGKWRARHHRAPGKRRMEILIDAGPEWDVAERPASTTALGKSGIGATGLGETRL